MPVFFTVLFSVPFFSFYETTPSFCLNLFRKNESQVNSTYQYLFDAIGIAFQGFPRSDASNNTILQEDTLVKRSNVSHTRMKNLFTHNAYRRKTYVEFIKREKEI